MADMPARRPESLRPAYPIRGDRLLLRPLTSRDIDALLAYRGREDVCRYVPFEPMTREGITERLTGQWTRTELTGEGQSLTLGAEVSQTGELAGDIVLFWRSEEHAGGEIGYVFNPRLGGRGYATEAVTMMLRLGFEELGMHRIIARIDERTIRRCGWPVGWACGRRPAWSRTSSSKGEWSTELDFAILAAE
jgi:RimJ/RimL family protein N-acetyltransferase